MAKITLDGDGYGDYSIAGLQFHDGQTEVDVLTVKQAYLLHTLGAKVDGDVQILTPPAFQDETAPEPEPAAPAHSSADDLAAIGTDGSWDSIGDQVTAEPELEPVEEAGLADDQYSVSPAVEEPATDPALDTPEVEPTPAPTVVETEGDAPTDVTPQPEAPQDGPADASTDAEPAPVILEPETPAADAADAEPETAPEEETPEALDDRIPAATDPIDTDAPAPVISEDPDGSTATEAAVLPSDDTAGAITSVDPAPAEDDSTGRHVADDSADTATA